MFRIFRHYVPASLFALVVIEFLLLTFSLYGGVAIRFISEESHADMGVIWPKALLFASVMFVALTAMGLYKNLYREGFNGVIIRLMLSLVLALAGMSIIFYLFPHTFMGRGVFAWSFVIAIVAIVVSRVVYFRVVGHENFKRRILVLGAGARAEQFKQLRRKVDSLGFNIVGFVRIEGEEDCVPAASIVELDIPLFEYVEQHHIDEVVVAIEDRRGSFPVEDLLDCKMSGVDVVDTQTFFERETGKVRLETLHPSWLIFSDGFRQSDAQLLAKRLFDIGASLLILGLTLPVILVTMAAIWLESGGRGPILYRQVRVGQNWKLFQVLKFRSMVVDAEKGGAPQWAKKNDARVTRVGKFIRRTRIDELPQIFNVLRGDMSFIGPRPERPEFVEKLAEKIPYYAERHRVKPGITGWAQIRYPYGASEQDAVEKLQYDLYYVKNYSLFLDCLILFQTAEVVLWGQGAR